MKREYIAVFIVALFARVVFLFLAPSKYQVFGDTAEYIETARRMCTTGAYPFEHIALPTFRAPGFPILLALISGCFIFPEWFLKLMLIFLDSIACLFGMGLVYNLSRREKQGRGVAFGMLYSFYPLFVQQSLALQSEGITILTILIGLFFISTCFIEQTLQLTLRTFLISAAGGVFFGISILTRPSALVLILLLLPVSVIGSIKVRRVALSTILGIAFVLAPWSIYASLKTGKLTVVNDSFCYSFYRGARLELLEVYSAADTESFNRAAHRSEAVIREAESRIKASDWCNSAVELLRESPSKQLKLAYFKLQAFFRPWPHVGAHQFWIVLFVGSLVSALYLSFLLVILQRSADVGIRRIKFFTCFYVLLVAVLHMPHQVSNRYRVPFVDPILMVIVTAYVSAPRRKIFASGT